MLGTRLDLNEKTLALTLEVGQAELTVCNFSDKARYFQEYIACRPLRRRANYIYTPLAASSRPSLRPNHKTKRMLAAICISR